MTTPISNATTTPTNQSAASGASASSPGNKQMFANSDFETFLKMLTVQMKNQDPLNPMEGSEFAVQLATFSGVEQQAYTNKLLEKMAQQQSGADGLMALSGWIGKDVRTTAPVHFGAAPLTLEIQPDAKADSVILVGRNAKGVEVTREEIGTGNGQVDWFGRTAGGDKLPDGIYSFRLESWAEGKKIAESAVPSFTRVNGVETTTAGVRLIFEGGASAPANEIDAVRNARQ